MKKEVYQYTTGWKELLAIVVVAFIRTLPTLLIISLVALLGYVIWDDFIYYLKDTFESILYLY